MRKKNCSLFRTKNMKTQNYLKYQCSYAPDPDTAGKFL